MTKLRSSIWKPTRIPSGLSSTWKDELLEGHHETTKETAQTSELDDSLGSEDPAGNGAPHVGEWVVGQRWTAVTTSTQGARLQSYEHSRTFHDNQLLNLTVWQKIALILQGRVLRH